MDTTTDSVKEDRAMTKTALSRRDKQILRLVAADKTYPQIGHALGLSTETIKTYAARLRAKLGIDTKVGLAVWATKNTETLDADDSEVPGRVGGVQGDPEGEAGRGA